MLALRSSGSGLGIILNAYPQGKFHPHGSEYAYAGAGDGFYCQFDAQYNTRGEPGLYYDTPLGCPPLGVPAIEYPAVSGFVKTLVNAIGRSKTGGKLPYLTVPMKSTTVSSLGRGYVTDFDMAKIYGFYPVIEGWVYDNKGYYPTGWMPDNEPEWDPAGRYGQSPAIPSGPLGQVDPSDPTHKTTAELINDMNEHNRKMFTLQIVATIAIALSAVVTTVRNAKLMKEERKKTRETNKLLKEVVEAS